MLLVTVRASLAQTGPATWRTEAALGLSLSGPTGFAPVTADEVAFGGSMRPLFRSQSRMDAAPGVDARVGVRLTARWQAEALVGINRSRLSTRIEADTEGAADLRITAPLTQYLVEFGILAELPPSRAHRAVLFLTGGGGYVRHLHEGRILVETGRSYYVGGGARFRSGETVGVRADARLRALADGALLDGARHLVPAVSVSLVVHF